MNALHRLDQIRLAHRSVDLFDVNIAARGQLFDRSVRDVLEQKDLDLASGIGRFCVGHERKIIAKSMLTLDHGFKKGLDRGRPAKRLKE